MCRDVRPVQGSLGVGLGRFRFQVDIFLEILKSVFIGIVEGITEWLPISSTGHMILVDEFMKLAVSPEFLALYLVVIQIGAIVAVIILYFHKLNPFSPKKTAEQRKGTWRLWGMVVIGCIPAALVGFVLDDWVNEHFYNAYTVAIALIFYGIVFIVLEMRNRRREAACMAEAGGAKAPHGKHARIKPSSGLGMHASGAGVSGIGPGGDGDDAELALFKVKTVDEINWKTALAIGCFQVLAIIPGTSRSGSTIIGGMLAGCSRTAAAEFTFFLAIPVMLGWGAVKCVKYFLSMGLAMTSVEVAVLVSGVVTAFVVSVLAIKFLMSYIKRNDFTAFGVYRIVLGVAVIAFFAATGAQVSS